MPDLEDATISDFPQNVVIFPLKLLDSISTVFPKRSTFCPWIDQTYPNSLQRPLEIHKFVTKIVRHNLSENCR